MKRTQNQDHFLCVPDLAAFIVCDGMGGHKGGETASLLAVTAICDSIRSAKNAGKGGAPWDAATALTQAIREANNAIHERAKTEPSLQGMGTTCTTLLFDKGTAFIGHVGDSRCYMLHPGRIWQLTRDHSLVQEKLRAGLITREQLKTDRMKNVITRSVGFDAAVEVDVYQFPIRAGDAFLLCSDGLSGLCEDAQISRIVGETAFAKGDLEGSVRSLAEAANANGGDDNVTTVLVNVA